MFVTESKTLLWIASCVLPSFMLQEVTANDGRIMRLAGNERRITIRIITAKGGPSSFSP